MNNPKTSLSFFIGQSKQIFDDTLNNLCKMSKYKPQFQNKYFYMLHDYQICNEIDLLSNTTRIKYKNLPLLSVTAPFRAGYYKPFNSNFNVTVCHRLRNYYTTTLFRCQ